jgi:hypothetical protein
MSDFRQTSTGDEVFLDHLAHWIPDMDSASAAFERLGFLLTPYTEHTNSTAPGEPILPAGSANRCIMLREGYLEVLTPTADTAIGQELRAGIDRYVGLHLIAFGCSDAEAQRARLIGEGFDQRPVVDLRREIILEDGSAGELQFTVIRPVPGAMAEGRIQFLTHHTPDLLWEERWMRHPNSAERLTDIVLCVADPDEAAGRYERYVGRDLQSIPGGRLMTCDRGRLTLLDPAALKRAIPGAEPPTLPFIAAYAIACGDLGRCRAHLDRTGIVCSALTDSVIAVSLPAALGGTILFTYNADQLPWMV